MYDTTVLLRKWMDIETNMGRCRLGVRPPGRTKNGPAVVDRAMDAHLAGEAAIAAHLSKAEQKILSKLLKKLVGMENEDERK
jgi:hypothetical protein